MMESKEQQNPDQAFASQCMLELQQDAKKGSIIYVKTLSRYMRQCQAEFRAQIPNFRERWNEMMTFVQFDPAQWTEVDFKHLPDLAYLRSQLPASKDQYDYRMLIYQVDRGEGPEAQKHFLMGEIERMYLARNHS
jgi:hypothetical protein